ncbi:recombinase family protein [Bacillus solimangrovi]|uniref:Serine recombinase n=1 Tax=Bacillus solimangrovi TaxID=1305675 RepID=A0A1E5LCY3_9BACI|nr:recombinase family protein [Bacillus solimangrovi]OEH91948.1 serine recombinase [Bacillus solimangrovi]
MKYAIYVRVSTDRDEQVSSVENQVDICRNWIERNGFEWNEKNVFKDEGISGTLFTERPAIQSILGKARKKEIDMIIFKSISRLARDLKDSLEIREVLIAHGVRIISIEEGYDSNKAGKNDMAFELWSLFSAQYSRTLSSGITAALAAKVRRGEHIGKVPYGYDRIEQKLVVNMKEANIIRQIFKWYNDEKLGYKMITHKLNEQGIPSKQNGKWQVTTVQRILKNSIYHGTFILNQYGKVKINGHKKQVKNPEEKWIIFENHHPAIISKKDFEKANDKKVLNDKRKTTVWNEFRGLLKCGKCGSNIVILQSGKKTESGSNVRYYLKCSAYRRAGKHRCVNHIPIQYEDFRDFLIDLLKEKGQGVSFEFDSELESYKTSEVKVLKKKIQQLEMKKKDVLELYLEQIINKSELENKRNELHSDIKQLKEKLMTFEHINYDLQTVENIQHAFSYLQQHGENLFHVIQTIINEIILHPDGTVDVKYNFK